MKPLLSTPEPPDPGPEQVGARRNGNVARLPKSVRDIINEMLRDGFSYPAIIRKLKTLKPPLPHKIIESNLSRWKAGGYQDWLKEQLWLEQTRARQEIALDMVRDFDATQVNHGALQIVTLRFFEAMRDPGPGSLEQKLGCNPVVFARIVSALCRASRETLALQKYQDACAKARALLNSLRDPKRRLSQKERRALILQVDEILGLNFSDPDAENDLPSITAVPPENMTTTTE